MPVGMGYGGTKLEPEGKVAEVGGTIPGGIWFPGGKMFEGMGYGGTAPLLGFKPVGNGTFSGLVGTGISEL